MGPGPEWADNLSFCSIFFVFPFLAGRFIRAEKANYAEGQILLPLNGRSDFGRKPFYGTITERKESGQGLSIKGTNARALSLVRSSGALTPDAV